MKTKWLNQTLEEILKNLRGDREKMIVELLSHALQGHMLTLVEKRSYTSEEVRYTFTWENPVEQEKHVSCKDFVVKVGKEKEPSLEFSKEYYVPVGYFHTEDYKKMYEEEKFDNKTLRNVNNTLKQDLADRDATIHAMRADILRQQNRIKELIKTKPLSRPVYVRKDYKKGELQLLAPDQLNNNNFYALRIGQYVDTSFETFRDTMRAYGVTVLEYPNKTCSECGQPTITD